MDNTLLDRYEKLLKEQFTLQNTLNQVKDTINESDIDDQTKKSVINMMKTPLEQPNSSIQSNEPLQNQKVLDAFFRFLGLG